MLKGLESRVRLPRLGIVRLGVTVVEPGKKPYPKEVDYFVAPDELKPIVGERPKRIAVMFPSDDVDRNLSAAYEKRSGKALEIRCDGEEAVHLLAQGGADVFPCPKEPRKPCPKGCQAKAHLNVLLPRGPVGSWWVLIGGEQRIADLWSELTIFKETFGRLTDIVFELERVETQVQVHTERGVIAKKGYPVHVRCGIAADQAMRARGLDVRALPGGQILPSDVPALPEGEGEAAPDEVNGGDVPSSATPAEIGTAPVPIAPRFDAARGAEEATPNARPGRAEARTGEPCVTPLPRSGGDDLDMEFDISMLYSVAKAAGVPPALYETYLKHTYRTDVDNLPVAALAEQARQWKIAQADSREAAKLREKILALVDLATRGRAIGRS